MDLDLFTLFADQLQIPDRPVVPANYKLYITLPWFIFHVLVGTIVIVLVLKLLRDAWRDRRASNSHTDNPTPTDTGSKDLSDDAPSPGQGAL